MSGHMGQSPLLLIFLVLYLSWIYLFYSFLSVHLLFDLLYRPIWVTTCMEGCDLHPQTRGGGGVYRLTLRIYRNN